MGEAIVAKENLIVDVWGRIYERNYLFYVLQILYNVVQAFTPLSCSALSTVRKKISVSESHRV